MIHSYPPSPPLPASSLSPCPDIKGMLGHLESALSLRRPPVCLPGTCVLGMLCLQRHRETKHSVCVLLLYGGRGFIPPHSTLSVSGMILSGAKPRRNVRFQLSCIELASKDKHDRHSVLMNLLHILSHTPCMFCHSFCFNTSLFRQVSESIINSAAVKSHT